MSVTCPECGEECNVHAEDFGYGVTEAWGVVKNDVRIIPVSDCCEAVVEDFPEPDFDPRDYDDD